MKKGRKKSVASAPPPPPPRQKLTFHRHRLIITLNRSPHPTQYMDITNPNAPKIFDRPPSPVQVLRQKWHTRRQRRDVERRREKRLEAGPSYPLNKAFVDSRASLKGTQPKPPPVKKDCVIS